MKNLCAGDLIPHLCHRLNLACTECAGSSNDSCKLSSSDDSWVPRFPHDGEDQVSIRPSRGVWQCHRGIWFLHPTWLCQNISAQRGAMGAWPHRSLE